MLTLAANTDMMAVMKGMTDPVSSILANPNDVKIKVERNLFEVSP